MTWSVLIGKTLIWLGNLVTILNYWIFKKSKTIWDLEGFRRGEVCGCHLAGDETVKRLKEAEERIPGSTECSSSKTTKKQWHLQVFKPVFNLPWAVQKVEAKVNLDRTLPGFG